MSHTRSQVTASTGSKLTALPRKEFLIRADDSEAVHGMSIGVQRGLSVLGVLSMLVFAVLVIMLTHFQGNIEATFKASKRRSLVEKGASAARTLQLLASAGDISEIDVARADLATVAGELHELHGYLHAAQKFDSVVEYMQADVLLMQELVSSPGNPRLAF